MTIFSEKTLFFTQLVYVAKTNKYLKVKVKGGSKSITLDVEFNSIVVKAIIRVQTLPK